MQKSHFYHPSYETTNESSKKYIYNRGRRLPARAPSARIGRLSLGLRTASCPSFAQPQLNDEGDEQPHAPHQQYTRPEHQGR